MAQGEIYHAIITEKKNLYVPSVKTISLDHMRNDEEYFGEALTLIKHMRLTQIISFNKDFDLELVAQLLPLCTLALMMRGPSRG